MISGSSLLEEEFSESDSTSSWLATGGLDVFGAKIPSGACDNGPEDRVRRRSVGAMVIFFSFMWCLE